MLSIVHLPSEPRRHWSVIPSIVVHWWWTTPRVSVYLMVLCFWFVQVPRWFMLGVASRMVWWPGAVAQVLGSWARFVQVMNLDV